HDTIAGDKANDLRLPGKFTPAVDSQPASVCLVRGRRDRGEICPSASRGRYRSRTRYRMLAQLEVIAGADRGRVFPLSPDAPLVIGRGRQSVTRLSDLRVSRVHCQVEFRGSDILIKDLNSVGGTLVNDRAVTEQILRAGDVIQLGETKLRLECPDVA